VTLQFVLGTNGYDHQEKLVEILKTQRATNPADRFFYLVPNHIKFESEVKVLKQLGNPVGLVFSAEYLAVPETTD
jgi:ATP-dependent helicase/nuclease subunit B